MLFPFVKARREEDLPSSYGEKVLNDLTLIGTIPKNFSIILHKK
jgi:hypothetical protein